MKNTLFLGSALTPPAGDGGQEEELGMRMRWDGLHGKRREGSQALFDGRSGSEACFFLFDCESDRGGFSRNGEDRVLGLGPKDSLGCFFMDGGSYGSRWRESGSPNEKVSRSTQLPR